MICCQCQPCACPTLHPPRAPALHPQEVQLGQGQAKESRSRMQKTQGRKLFNQFIRRACCTCMCVCLSPSLFLSPSLCVCVFGNNRQDINLQFSTQTSRRAVKVKRPKICLNNYRDNTLPCVCEGEREREGKGGHYVRCLAVEHVIGLALHWLYKQTICQMQIQITLLGCLSLSPCHAYPLLFGCPCRALACCCVANWKTIRNQSQPAKAGRGSRRDRRATDGDGAGDGGGAGSGSWRSINNSCGMFYGRSSKPFRITHTPHPQHTHTHTLAPLSGYANVTFKCWPRASEAEHLLACPCSCLTTHGAPPHPPPPLLLTPQGRAVSMARVIARQIDGQSSISLVVWPLAIITGSPQCPRSPPACDWCWRARSICQRFASSTDAVGATLCALN